MTDQTPMDRIREALAAVRDLGPTLSRLDLSPNLWVALKTASLERQSHVAGALPLLSGIPVRVDRSLPPWARREHWTDGRVVTRYRLVMDRRVLQVAFQVVTAGGRRGQAAKVHHLSLFVKRFGWVPAVSPVHGGAVTSSWKGQRVSPYLPGLARMAQVAGLTLEPWQHAVPRWRERLSPGCACGAPVGAPIIVCPAHPPRQGSPDDARPLNPDQPS